MKEKKQKNKQEKQRKSNPVPAKPVTPPKPVEEKKKTVIKEIVRASPDKKKGGFNAFDRLSIRGKRKPEMKDAWTQTTPRPRDERRARRHAAAREAAAKKEKEQQAQLQ